jgi:hypothetical protein
VGDDGRCWFVSAGSLVFRRLIMSCLSVVVGVGDGWRLEPCRASEVTKGLKMWAVAVS